MRYLLLFLVLVLQVNNVAGYNVPILPKTCVQNTLTSENSDSNVCSCNRYAYCLNSPLKYVDPTGYFFDEWEMNLNTGDMTRIGIKGGDRTHFVNLIDDYGNFWGEYAFPAQDFSYNWSKDIFGDVSLSISGSYLSFGLYNVFESASFFQTFNNVEGLSFDGMKLSSYAAGTQYYDFSSDVSYLASGRTDFSSFNIGGLIGIGQAMKGLVSAAATAIGRVMGTNVARTGSNLTTRFISTADGIVDLQPTLNRIASGTKFPHRHDGTIFKNVEGLLPKQSGGYYKEFVHPTPGVNGAGLQRIVTGKKGEMWFTPDHYKTFIPIR